jgi:ketosteroid isomerase-like protein
MQGVVPQALAAVLLSAFLLQGCAATREPDPQSDAALIDGLRRQIRDAELAGDASVFGRVAVAEVVVMPPGAAPIQGRDATVTAMQGFFRNFELRIDYSAAQVDVHGDTAIDHGTFTQTVVPKNAANDAPPRASAGSYLWVYRRMPDGSWQQTHAIWNLKP